MARVTGVGGVFLRSADPKALGEGNQAVMINYRVDDLDALLVDLAAAGVWIDPKRQNESYGRFAWIKDCDGNRVELWQPLEAPET